MSKIKQALARDERVSEVYSDSDGHWVILKPGWRDRESLTHSFHEQTLARLRQSFRRVEKCTCEECLSADHRSWAVGDRIRFSESSKIVWKVDRIVNSGLVLSVFSGYKDGHQHLCEWRIVKDGTKI